MQRVVLVTGPTEAAAEVAARLRSRGFDAWSDRIGRVAMDPVSTDWADALVIVDPSEHVEAQHVRPLLEFRGPSVLAVHPALPGCEVVRLLERGFDAVVRWADDPEALCAFVSRALGAPAPVSALS